MKKTLFLMLSLAFATTLCAQLSSEFFDVKIEEVQSNGQIWNDSGSGASVDIAFWKVKPSQGYYALGHFTTTYHSIDKDLKHNPPVTITLKPKPGKEFLLKKPTGYKRIWSDAGSDAHSDVTIYRMECPAGYVSLGDLATNGPKPDGNECRCIKEQTTNSKGESVRLVSRAKYLDFAKEGETDKKPFWTDAGTGAKDDVSIWMMYTNQTPPKRNQVYMVASTFRANKYHSMPPAEDCYSLVLEFPEEDILERVKMNDKKIKLKGPQLPTNEEMRASEVVNEYSLPFFAVNDPDYTSQLEQFRESPTYKVRRTTSFVAIDSYEPTNEDTKQFSVTTGKSNETNYSNEVGVSLGLSVTIGGEAGIPVAKTSATVTASVEVSYSHTWGGATTNYEERSFTYPQTVTGGCFGALFQAKSKYTIYRKDGSVVGAPVEVKINEFYTDEWCPEEVKKEKEGEKVKNSGGNNSPNAVTFTIDAPPGKTVIIEGRIEIYDGKVVSSPKDLTVAPPPSVYKTAKDKVLLISSPRDIVSAGNVINASYTKSAWVKLSSAPHNGPNNIISGAYQGRGPEHAFWAPGIFKNHLAAGHNEKWDFVKSPNPLTAAWHHTVVTYDANQKTMILYVDGDKVDMATGVPNFKTHTQKNTLIGGFDGKYNFNGEIKNVQIWNKPLSGEQIMDIYTSTSNPIKI